MIELEKLWKSIKQEANEKGIHFSNDLEDGICLDKIENEEIIINVNDLNSYYELENIKEEIEKL